MSELGNIHKILSDVRVTVGRIDERLETVVERADRNERDISKLKQHRSWLAGAYFAAVATISTYFTFKK